MSPVIVADDLVKVYAAKRGAPAVRALDGLSLEVDQGTILAVLGPNGAGKTTLVRTLATLLHPDAGRASVCGFDVVRQPDEVRRRIGLSGQYAAVDENLTGFENLYMFGRLHQLGARAARARANALLERFELADAGNRVAKTYSGGMRRRLDLAGALVREPQVLFLDEPTTGLDPRSRLGMWAVIRDLVAQGTTLLLTTQYLEEADELADRITVVDTGRIIADGTADTLKAQVGGERIEVVPRGDIEDARRALAAFGEATVDENSRRLAVPAREPREVLDVMAALDAHGVVIDDLAFRRPTLDEVFLALTARTVEAS